MPHRGHHGTRRAVCLGRVFVHGGQPAHRAHPGALPGADEAKRPARSRRTALCRSDTAPSVRRFLGTVHAPLAR